MRTTKSSGFTLIEILVVFSITAILTGVGFASFATYSQSQQVVQAANNIHLLVNQARFNSLNTVKTNTDEGGVRRTCVDEYANLNGYSIQRSGQQITLLQLCSGSGGSISYAIKSIALSSPISIGLGTSCTTITYNGLTATPNGTPCEIVVTGNNNTKTVRIDAGGIVSVR